MEKLNDFQQKESLTSSGISVALLVVLLGVEHQATNIMQIEPVDSVADLANTGIRGMTHFQFEHSWQTEQTKVAEVANEIARYLQRSKGNTAETLEGILEWWIPQQRILEERYWVEQAIKQLCEKGVLFMRKNLDGSVIYSTNTRLQPRTVDE